MYTHAQVKYNTQLWAIIRKEVSFANKDYNKGLAKQ